MRDLTRSLLALSFTLVTLPLFGATNLLTNPGFAGTLSPWSIANNPGATLDPLDRLHAISSGSLQMLVSGSANGGEVSQCLQAGPGAYEGGVHTWIPPFQSTTGSTFMVVAAYSNPTCSGAALVTNQFAQFKAATPDFQAGAQGVTLPAATLSVKVSMVINRDQASGTFTAYFDDAYFRLAGGCAPSSVQMCLDNGRFRVSAVYQAPGTAGGIARVVQLTPDSGYLWFFNQENAEVLIKVLDACSFDTHHWVFSGGLTNVLVNITVVDTKTGVSRSYSNAQGTAFKPIQDTAAFICP